MAKSYQDWMSGPGFGPNWMHDPVGTAYWGAIGAAIDQQNARMITGLRSRYPMDALAAGMSDALNQQGRDCMLPRGGTTPGGTDETDASYAPRLQAKWNTWAQAGKPLGLLLALKAAGFPVVTPTANPLYYLQADTTLGTSAPGVSGTFIATVEASTGGLFPIPNAATLISQSSAMGLDIWQAGYVTVTIRCRMDPATIPGGYAGGYQIGARIQRGGGAGDFYGSILSVGAIPTDGSWAVKTVSVPVAMMSGSTIDPLVMGFVARAATSAGNGAQFQIAYGGATPTTVQTLPALAGAMLLNHLGQAYQVDAGGNLIVTAPCAACSNRHDLHGNIPSPALHGFTLDCRDQFFAHFCILFLEAVTGLANTTGNLVKACLNQTVSRWRCAGAHYNGAAIVPPGARVLGWPPTVKLGDAGLTLGANGVVFIDPS